MMGTALEMKRMPAVTLRKSMANAAQNWGVRAIEPGVKSGPSAAATAAAGEGGGFRTSSAPAPPRTAKATPESAKACITASADAAPPAPAKAGSERRSWA